MVAPHAPQPMRHGAVYMFVILHSISFPLQEFLFVCACVRAAVGLGRRVSRICRGRGLGREGCRRSRSRARARMRGRGGVVVVGVRFGFGGEAMTSLLGVWRGFLVLRLGWLLRWFWLWRVVLGGLLGCRWVGMVLWRHGSR